MKRLLRWGSVAIAAGLAIGLFTNHLVKAQAPGVNSPFQPTWDLPYSSIQRTYSVGFQMSPQGFATDIVQLCGASGVITKLVRLYINGRATAVSPMDIYLIQRSTADTGGSGNVITGTPMDANDAAAKATLTFYGTNPTLGAQIGIIGLIQKYVGNLTTGVFGSPGYDFFYGYDASKTPTLRSAAQCVVANLSGTSQGGNLLNIAATWTEE